LPNKPIYNQIDLLSDFNGSSLDEYHWENQTLLVCDLANEPIVYADYEEHDYNLHFIFGLKNNALEPKSFQIKINTDDTHPTPTTIFISNNPNQISNPNPYKAFTVTHGYQFQVTLDPKSTTYISNTLWTSKEKIEKEFTQLSSNNIVKTIHYGFTCDNLPLKAYQLFQQRNNKLPLICVSSGSHPMEGDTIATSSIMSYLIENHSNILNKADFIIIPVLNPDGFVRGLNGCNSRGINFFWDFQNDNLDTCPEAYYFWQFLKEFPPNIYIDFHSYSTQGQSKTFGPYVKPSVLYCGSSVKKAAQKLARSLQTIPNSKAQAMFSPSSMPHKITQEFNTITFAKYHLHQEMGESGMRKTALLVIEKIMDAIDPSQLKNQILNPYGPLNKTIVDSFLQKCFMSRYYLPKYVKKLLGF